MEGTGESHFFLLPFGLIFSGKLSKRHAASELFVSREEAVKG